MSLSPNVFMPLGIELNGLKVRKDFQEAARHHLKARDGPEELSGDFHIYEPH